MPARSALQVVKIGGSLLLRRGLLDDLDGWWQLRPARPTVFLVGGGQLIDAVRAWDKARPGDPAAVHWSCVDLLRGSFDHLAEQFASDARFSDVTLISDRTEFNDFAAASSPPATQSSDAVGRMLLKVSAAYHRHAGGAFARLPSTWETTTDAIALALAEQLNATECVILKSCPIPNACLSNQPAYAVGPVDVRRLISLGILDPASGFASEPDYRPRISIQKLPESQRPDTGSACE
ncbi:MAG: protein kinase [Planctomycetota bacterium]